MQQHLKRQAGVQDAVVSLRDGKVDITPKEDGSIDPSQLLKATYDSGVTVAEMDMTGTGRVIHLPSGELALQVQPNRTFAITPNELSRRLEPLVHYPGTFSRSNLRSITSSRSITVVG